MLSKGTPAGKVISIMDFCQVRDNLSVTVADFFGELTIGNGLRDGESSMLNDPVIWLWDAMGHGVSDTVDVECWKASMIMISNGLLAITNFYSPDELSINHVAYRFLSLLIRRAWSFGFIGTEFGAGLCQRTAALVDG